MAGDGNVAVLDNQTLGAVFGKAPEAEKPKTKIYGQRKPVVIEWPFELLHLPRTFAMRCSDLDINADSRDSFVRKAISPKRDKVEYEKFNAALNVVLELMGRYKQPRQCIDNTGTKLFLDHEGNLTTRQWSQTVKDHEGRPLRHEAAMEDRSPWGVRPGIECITAPNTKMPEPAHYKKMVIANFDDLLPRLRFLQSHLADDEMSPIGENTDERAYMERFAELTSDENEKRKELQTWLPNFLKNPVTSWNGLD